MRAPGVDVVDLDEESGTLAYVADLLVSMSDHRRFIKVKPEGQNARESMVHDLRRHVQPGPTCLPEGFVGGSMLAVNHQHRRLYADRSSTVYS